MGLINSGGDGFLLAIIKIYFYFLSFLSTEVVQVFEVHQCGRLGSVYHADDKLEMKGSKVSAITYALTYKFMLNSLCPMALVQLMAYCVEASSLILVILLP